MNPYRILKVLPSLIWLIPGTHLIYCFLYWLLSMEGSLNISKEFGARVFIGAFLALVTTLFSPLWIWDTYGRDWDEKADDWDFNKYKRPEDEPSRF